MFLSDTDRSRPMDMSPVNAKLSLQRALCFHNFVPKPETEFDAFLKKHFDDILDFRKKTYWKSVPVENCRDFLDFPPVIHTGKADYANELTYFSLAQFQPKMMAVYLRTKEYQSFNFFAAILENCHLKKSILRSPPLSGQTDGLEVIRFKTPFLYNQAGYNSEAYKGFIIYNRIARFDQDHIDKTRLQGSDLRNTDQPNYYFTNTFKLWFCSCSAGSRSKGSCVHVLSVIMGLSLTQKQRELFDVMQSPSLDAETFPDTHISPESVLQQRPSGSSESPQPSAKRRRQ